MDDRIKILQKLENIQDYNKYTDCLLKIYHAFNSRRTFLSKYLTSDCMVMGGMLYFLLYREAKLLGLIQKDVDTKILEKFLKFKTIDMDVQGHIQNDDYDEYNNSFLKDSSDLKENYSEIMKDIFHEHEPCFNFLHSILQNKPLCEKEQDVIVGTNFGIALDVKLPFRSTGALEYRPKINVKIGEHEDHIFEALLLVNFDKPLTNVYNLRCVDKAFLGENIVVSITQQIFPNERAWLQVSNFKDKHPSEIFKELKDIFDHDKLALIKFKQGYYRSYVMFYILQKAYERNEENLLKIMLPTNEVLMNKLFFLKSRTVSKITPKYIIDLASELNKEIKLKPKQQIATALDTIRFIKLCLSMWESYNKILDEM